jgi:hypothetical protein
LRRPPLQPLDRHQRLSDIKARFTCGVCGKRGADVRPDCNWNRRPGAVMGCRRLLPANENVVKNIFK